MCGIVGILNIKGDRVSQESILSLTDLIAHRGPDGSGVETSGPVGFGHRRLSIIDPALGKQPMCSEDNSLWLTFNGEIYNFKDLRLELIAKGYCFKTKSDTEVILHAYKEWGEACVERFRGMFAFAIADFRNQKIFVARDQFGIKPFYYLQTPETFAFCSEFHPLTKISNLNLSLDFQAIDQYLWLQYIPAPRTAVAEIKKLEPGHRISISFSGKLRGPESFAKLDFNPNTARSKEEVLEHLDEVLEDSVRAHLVSDVPFGVFLSGGIDSSLILAYMTRILEKPVKAFSIGFDEDDFNEIPYATIAAKRFEAEHHIEIVRPDALGILPDLVRHFGEPFGDSSAVATYYVSKLARKHVPMVLGGDGADEAFAGYNSYRGFSPRFASNGLRPSLEEWLEIIHYIGTPTRHSLWRKDFQAITEVPLECFEREFQYSSKYSVTHQLQYMDIKTYMPFDILTKVDTTSMMNGLEVRVPFIDPRVIGFASTIPDQYCLNDSTRGTWEGKLPLKELALKYFPEDFVYRPKKGFAIPLAKWFTHGGELHEPVREILLSSSARNSALFEPQAVDALIQQNQFRPVWLILFLEEWMKQNL